MESGIKFYEGNKLRKPFIKNGKILLEAYIPDDPLKEVVNLAFILKKRPILLMGDPGSGKTKLAEAVAFELYGEEYERHYFPWFIKSTTKAKDGLYHYDALRRLNDAQINNQLPLKEQKNINNLKLDAKGSYITRGILGKAFSASKKGQPAIVLIDEIDKADIDFPNDLLMEIEQQKIFIEETNEIIEAPEEPPIIFITSNNEKELPPAFLRRCIYHFIEFPNESQLKDILNAHFAGADPEYIKKAVQRFLQLRKKLGQQLPDAEKKVSTSELVDWFSIINRFHTKNIVGKAEVEANLIKQLDNLEKEDGPLPFYQLLLKNIEARQLFVGQINNL